MLRSLMRLVPTVVLTVVLAVVLAVPALLLASSSSATAQEWDGSDVRGDVSHYDFDPSSGDAPDCAEPAYRSAPDDARRDITGLAVAHGQDTVDLTVTMRSVRQRDDETFYAWFLRTPDERYLVSVARVRAGGELLADLLVEGRRVGSDGCGGRLRHRACAGLVAGVDARAEQVSVHLPRRCLRDPRWVRAGAQVYGLASRGAGQRPDVAYDEWGVRGPGGGQSHPTFGPRVHRS